MKKRILHIGGIPTEFGGRSTGGIATHRWELASRFQRRGYKVFIFSGEGPSFIRDGVEIIGAGKKGRAYKAWRAAAGSFISTAPLKYFKFREAAHLLHLSDLMKKTISRVEPDLIHLHSLLNPLGLSFSAKPLAVPPMVATNYELWFSAADDRKVALANRIAEAAAGMIHISQYTLERAQNLGVRLPGYSRVIHIPVREDRVPLLDRPKAKIELGLDNKKIVFFCGTYRAITKKGLDFLFGAFSANAKLREKCRLIVRTSGEGLSFARERFKKNGISGRILDQLSWDAMVKYFNAADVFVMPSRSEGFGIVYLEALLAGTPVVGFCRTLAEIETAMGMPLGNRFDAENEDAYDLAEKILEVLESNFDRESLRTAVLDNFSWEKKFPEYKRFYDEAAR